MCGIVGSVGQSRVLPFLLDGLSRLEYRGYDSAGVAWLQDGNITTVKSAGRLTVLQEKLQGYDSTGLVGIGHTRWATHGVPSDQNAHPHQSPNGRFAVVHNGIIENFAELKAELEEKGFVFSSDTDTEVIAHLLQAYAQPDFLRTVSQVVKRLCGSYALGILDRENPQMLLAVRRDSPLVIGYGKRAFYLASDVPAILPYTRCVSFMEDGEIAVLTPERASFYRNEQPVLKAPQTVNWSMDAAEKDGFDHFMLKEIHEEPSVLFQTLQHGTFLLNPMPDQIHIVACGSAYHVGVMGKYVIERLAHIPVSVDIASEYRYRNPVIRPGTLVVVISQSGETADTLAALREAKRRGAEVLAIVNVRGSTMAREADTVFYTSAGPEIAVATTKAYAAQLLAIYRLAMALAKQGKKLTDLERDALASELKTLPQKVETVLCMQESVCRCAVRFYRSENVFFIGRGMDYALAMEGSLKLKEISYIHSEAYGAGELKHGTISLIQEGSLVIALCTQHALVEKMISNIREVKSRGAVVVTIAQAGMEKLETCSDVLLTVPKTCDLFSCLPAATLLQLFAYYVALERGCDIDKPRNLAKSVTVE